MGIKKRLAGPKQRTMMREVCGGQDLFHIRPLGHAIAILRQ